MIDNINSIETNGLHIYINGKNDLTETYSIQRHIPECDMILFTTETGHTLFCQEDHPLIIHRNNKEIIIPADEVTVGDFIYINNTICNNIQSRVPKESPYEIAKLLFDNEIIEFKKDFILKGKSKHTIRFEQDFINYNKKWLKEFINCAVDIGIKTESYVLAQQMKLMADKANINLEINLHNSTPIYFTMHIKEKDVYKIINGNVRINLIEKNIKWKHYVYDVKTKSNEYMLGCVQNHNSFHTGGVLTKDIPDIFKEMADTISESNVYKLKNNMEQKEDILYATGNIIIEVINNKYEDKFKIIQKDDYLILPTGIFYLTVTDEKFKFEVHIEREINLFYPSDKEKINITKEKIILEYNKGDKIFEAKGNSIDFSKMTSRVDDIIAGKTPDTSVPSIFLSLFNTLKGSGDWDSVHLEVVMSNIFRWPQDPQIPSRLKQPYEYEQFSIKTLPMIISWTLGLAFENATKAITYGLISERGPENEIEKILVGDI